MLKGRKEIVMTTTDLYLGRTGPEAVGLSDLLEFIYLQHAMEKSLDSAMRMGEREVAGSNWEN